MEEYSNGLIIFISALIPTLFTLYLTERVKASVKSSFDEKLEGVKKENTKEIEELKKEYAKEISEFQTELTHLKSKENFKFTKLHEKRFEVLQETYKFLNENIKFLEAYLKPVNPLNVGTIDKGAMKRDYMLSDEKFLDYFSLNKIFFTKEISDILAKYFKHSKDVFQDYVIDEYFSKFTQPNDADMEVKLSKAHINHTLMVEPIKIEIENEFRKLLGE